MDQRENRRRVGEMSRGKTVLNLFSYAGGFSLRAALGGATRVTSVDVAGQAHATAQESFKRAGVATTGHEFITQDCFAFLDDAKKRGKKWDFVVSDPPSFAPNAKAVPGALSAYRQLHRACVSVLAPGGIFCAASCSSPCERGVVRDDARRRGARARSSSRRASRRAVRSPDARRVSRRSLFEIRGARVERNFSSTTTPDTISRCASRPRSARAARAPRSSFRVTE